MKIVDVPIGDLFHAVYEELIVPSFPDDELVTESALRDGLDSGKSLCSAAIDDFGRPLAAMYGDWSESSRVMCLGYIVVAQHLRGTGIGGEIYDHVLRQWHQRYAPCLIVAEVEHPDHHASSPEHGDPVRRLRFYGHHRARVLDLPYFQPAVSAQANRVYAMLLLLLHADTQLAGSAGPGTVSGVALRRFLTEYLETVEGAVTTEPATTALLSAVDRPGGVPALPIAEYRQVPVSHRQGHR